MFRYLIFFFLGIFINAQTNPFTINGLVSDEQKKPITNASIKLKDNTYEYTLNTDEKGYFSKKLYSVGEKIEISISHKGYETLDTSITPHQEKYIFTLTQKIKEIEEVVLERGIIQKGDSTIYKADFFSNKRENKVVDLLKKLPDVEVDRQGKITVKGKEVEKVLVENETFFTGSSSLAINSLPADVVDRFEVIDNYKENSILGGNSEKTVLNIALKEEKKKLVFGDIFLGGNSTNKYKTGANLFYYAPENKVNLISNLNNTSESAFSMEDYMMFNGGIDRLLRDPASFMRNINAKELMALLTPSEKHHTKNIFNAVNFSKNIFNNKFKLSIFNINHWNDSQEIKENEINFRETALSILNRKEEIHQDKKNRNNTFNLMISNNHTENVDFYYNFTLKNANLQTESTKHSHFLNTIGNHDEYSKNKNIHLSQVLDFNYKIAENHAQGFLLNFITSTGKTAHQISSDNLAFFHSIFNLSQPQNIILQNNNEKNLHFTFNFQHKYNFLTHHQLGLNAHFLRSQQDIRNNFRVNDLPANFLSNFIGLGKNHSGLALEYLFKNKSFTISLINDFINTSTHFKSLLHRTNAEAFFWLPTAKIEYKNVGIGNFNLSYQKSIRDIIPHYYHSDNYLVSPIYLFKGMENPQNPLSEKIVFKYEKKSGYYGYGIDIKYQYTNKLKDYITKTETTSLQKTNTILFSHDVGAKNELELKLEKKIFKKKIVLISRNRLSWEQQREQINHQDALSQIRSKHFNIGIKSQLNGNYHFEVFHHYHHNVYQNILSKTEQHLHEIGFIFTANPTDKWAIHTDFSLNKDWKNHLQYSKSSLKVDYFLNSNIQFNVFINNILNSKKKISINNDDIFSFYQQEYLMPRFFYVGLTYKF